MVINKKDIIEELVYLMEDGERILGFYQFNIREDRSELVWFFTARESIGKGLGSLLWKNLVLRIKALGVKQFIIKSDPNAEGFYLKNGAINIGSTESVIDKNIKLALLKYRIN